jgi:hypothetical protein
VTQGWRKLHTEGIHGLFPRQFLWSKAYIILNHSDTGIVGSNPARGMDVHIFLCCAVLRG